MIQNRITTSVRKKEYNLVGKENSTTTYQKSRPRGLCCDPRQNQNKEGNPRVLVEKQVELKEKKRQRDIGISKGIRRGKGNKWVTDYNKRSNEYISYSIRILTRSQVSISSFHLH